MQKAIDFPSFTFSQQLRLFAFNPVTRNRNGPWAGGKVAGKLSLGWVLG